MADLMNFSAALVSAFAAPLAQSDTGVGRLVQLLPAGSFTAIDGRGPYTTGSKVAMQEIVSRTLDFQGGRQLAIDYDHQSIFGAKDGVGGRAPAAGWIEELQVRDSGIWAKVKWTEAAASAIRAGEYKYISPVILHTKAGKVLALRMASLVNTPAFDMSAVAASALLNKGNSDMEQLDGLKKLLGLDEAADIVAIMAKVQELLETSANSATPDPAQFVPIGDFQKVLNEANKLRQGITTAEAEMLVSGHIASGHLPPALKDWAVSACTSNKQVFDEFMAGVAPSVVRIVTPQLGNRRLPEKSANGNLTEQEVAVCSALGLTTEEFTKAQASAATNLE